MQLLPDELVLNILSHVSTTDASLYSLCLVSQRLRRLSTPLLYNTFTTSSSDPGKPITLFVDSLLRDSTLALSECVRELRLLSWDASLNTSDRIVDTRSSSSLTAPALEDKHVPETSPQFWLIIQQLYELMPSDYLSEIFNKRLSNGHEAIYAAILLCVATRLERLHVAFPSMMDPDTLDVVVALLNTSIGLKKSPFAAAPFQCLRKVFICNSNGVHSVSLAPIMHLPALQSLVGTECLGLDHSGPWPAIGTSHVKQLTFTRSQMTTAYISCLIRSCSNLAVFDFEFGRIHNPTLLLIDFNELGAALAMQSDSLKRIEIKCADTGMLWYYHARHSAQNFRFFNNLRKLTISASAILDDTGTIPREYTNYIVDYLPPSLEAISIDFWPHVKSHQFSSHADSWSTKPLLELASAADALPLLRNVEISIHSRQAVDVDMEAIRETFRNRNCDFDVVYRLLPFPLRSFLGFEG